MKNKVFAILIILIVLLMVQYTFSSSEAYRAVANAQCVKLTQNLCETEQTKNLIAGTETYDCQWDETRSWCVAANFTINQNLVNQQNQNRNQNIALLLLSYKVPLIALALIIFVFFYFKKNISTETPTLKKFVLTAIGMTLVTLILQSIVFGVNSNSDVSSDIIVAFLMIFIIQTGIIYLIFKYFTKIKKVLFWTLLINVILNLEILLILLVILVSVILLMPGK